MPCVYGQVLTVLFASELVAYNSHWLSKIHLRRQYLECLPAVSWHKCQVDHELSFQVDLSTCRLINKIATIKVIENICKSWDDTELSAQRPELSIQELPRFQVPAQP